MIKFNNVIENFNTVYENRNSPENPCFLNPSLELVKDKAEKASFFDIVDALQSRRWETEETTSETSKAIKKLYKHMHSIDKISIPLSRSCNARSARFNQFWVLVLISVYCSATTSIFSFIAILASAEVPRTNFL